MSDSNARSPIGCTDHAPAASLEMLRMRAKLLARLRRFFARRGYWEVETPILSRDVVVDAHLEPFVTLNEGGELFLQTSPEFAMKRLLAAGAEAIYQITRAFRRGEQGRLHNPEFTLVEWYRAGDTHFEQMDFVEELVRDVLVFALGAGLPTPPKPTTAGLHSVEETCGRDSGRVGEPGHSAAAPPQQFERMTYNDAFEQLAGTRVLKLSSKELRELARERGVSAPVGLDPGDRDGWLNLLLAELVEPYLGRGRPTILYDYPASQAALARIRPEDPPVAERFELYIDGVEICNGYHELTDADDLRDRCRRQNELRRRQGRRPLPVESRLLAAMEAGLPACSGVALGFDRLAMLAVGARSLEEVMPFPWERA